MTSGNSGAVFFLGTRAHYQVLQQPDSRLDSENGNAPAETGHREGGGGATRAPADVTVVYEDERQELGVGVKRRIKRRHDDAAPGGAERVERPAAPSGAAGGEPRKGKPSRGSSLLGLMRGLARRGVHGARRQRPQPRPEQQLRHLRAALACTYRESCRCMDCQSRYFECDDSEEYSSDDSSYMQQYVVPSGFDLEHGYEEDSDDEVFINSLPDDNTSTELLIDGKEKMSVSSDALDDAEARLEAEVAAGTPVLLNYLLTHPITCALQ